MTADQQLRLDGWTHLLIATFVSSSSLRPALRGGQGEMDATTHARGPRGLQRANVPKGECFGGTCPLVWR